jgi:hypothetical protein
MWFQSVDPDPVATVSSVLPGYHYLCPDIATIDRHIAELREHLGPHSNLTPERQRASRKDIDRLLDRRLYLAMIEGGELAA